MFMFALVMIIVDSSRLQFPIIPSALFVVGMVSASAALFGME